MKIIKETERLYLAEATTKDAVFMLALLNSEGWLEFIGDRNVRTETEAAKYLEERVIKAYTEGFGMYNVILKSTGEILGMCGLVNRPTLEGIDIGFGFLPQYMGKGYALESAKAVMAFAKKDLELTEILGITTQSNIRSQKLLEKLGLTIVKNYTDKSDGSPMFLYKIEF
ncbi:MAG: GNAT family N-acetyltransferase [Saprospiraceae bacterium]